MVEDAKSIGKDGGADGGEGGGEQADEQAKADAAAAALKQKRTDFLARQAVKAQQDALRQGVTGGNNEQTDDIDLTDVPEPARAAIRAALDDRRKVRGVVSEALKFGMESSRKAKAYELASELAIDKDGIPDLIASLTSANTPEQLELRAKELVIEFKSDGSLAAPVVKPADKKGEQPDAERKFDTGRSSSANRTSALLEKIDQIDPADPKAQAMLEALKKDVDAAQARANARGVRA